MALYTSFLSIGVAFGVVIDGYVFQYIKTIY